MNGVKQIGVFVIAFLALGCEGIVGDTGYIYSSETNEPLSDVTVTLFVKNKKTSTIITKSDGYFDASSFVGCTPKCPGAGMQFLKKGFKPKIIKDVDSYTKKHPNNGKGYMIILLEPN